MEGLEEARKACAFCVGAPADDTGDLKWIEWLAGWGCQECADALGDDG